MLGMFAVSKAGHDQGQMYVVLKEEGDSVLLADGRLKTIESPKKKNKKHIQLVKTGLDENLVIKIKNQQPINNEEIKAAIKCRIKEVAQSLIRELECPAWLETEAGVSVKVALNSTESAGESLNGIEFAVLKAKEPEFIKKIVETGEEEE